MARVSKARRAECIEQLRELVKPGDTVYTTIKHVSRSGMQRSIDVHVIRDNEPRWISRYVADAIGATFDERREAVKMGGAGMDMGFALVYKLSHALFSDGFGCIGEGDTPGSPGRCPSSDHLNGDRDYTPHANNADRLGADGSLCTCHTDHWHTSGGYALNQRWM